MKRQSSKCVCFLARLPNSLNQHFQHFLSNYRKDLQATDWWLRGKTFDAPSLKASVKTKFLAPHIRDFAYLEWDSKKATTMTIKLTAACLYGESYTKLVSFSGCKAARLAHCSPTRVTVIVEEPGNEVHLIFSPESPYSLSHDIHHRSISVPVPLANQVCLYE